MNELFDDSTCALFGDPTCALFGAARRALPGAARRRVDVTMSVLSFFMPTSWRCNNAL
jgi:hypothetical protein